MTLVCWYRFVSLCLQGWFIAHFRHVVSRSRYQDYERENPYVGRWRPQGGLNMLITSEACWIRWSIVMSPGGCTSTDETWRLFRTCAGTLDGSWPANRGWCVNCRSGFWGSTYMFRLFPDLLLRSCLLPQQMWLLPSWSLLSMLLPSSIGVPSVMPYFY